MNFFVSGFKWVMLISGVLTCTMFFGLIFPEESLKSTFGESIHSPADEILVRNWSALIGLMGIMLIYGAFVPAVRKFSLIIAGTSKLIFICLILSLGQTYLDFSAGTAVIVDSLMLILFAMYLYFSRLSKLPVQG